MSDACVIATGAISALGQGPRAYSMGEVGDRPRVAIERDATLESAGLTRPFCARAARTSEIEASGDPASDLLLVALRGAMSDLDRARPGWRRERIGLAIGTSSGGMINAERFFEGRERGAIDARVAERATYFAPLDRAIDLSRLERPVHTTQVLAACAASTIAIGLALRWLDRGACDLVLAGGYDAVSVFVAAGFEVLRATTASRPKPFRTSRDGMSLGEGAAIVAMVREEHARGASVIARIAGFGASTDAVHVTAPDRTGGGLARAGKAAIADAGVDPRSVTLVSAHATATPFNDAMEQKAIARMLEHDDAIVHPMKAQIGHTLGAAGALEMLAAADAITRGVAPAAAGEGEVDPGARVNLLERNEARTIDAAIKLSAAFGGTNAALVLTRAPSARRPPSPRAVFFRAGARVRDVDLHELARATGVATDRLARLDALERLAMAALAKLAASVSREALEGAGVVAGHALATIDTNAGFDAKKRARGAAFVEPRVFPATSPNAVAGECAIVYKLTGPGFSVGAGLDGATEALLAATEMIAAGDADRMIVLASDDAGPAAHDLLRAARLAHRPFAKGAVAILLDGAPTGAAREVPLDWSIVDHAGAPIGHLALATRFDLE